MVIFWCIFFKFTSANNNFNFLCDILTLILRPAATGRAGFVNGLVTWSIYLLKNSNYQLSVDGFPSEPEIQWGICQLYGYFYRLLVARKMDRKYGRPCTIVMFIVLRSNKTTACTSCSVASERRYYRTLLQIIYNREPMRSRRSPFVVSILLRHSDRTSI